MSGPGDDREGGPAGGHDPDLRAAEYALGTLGADERAAMARALAADPDAARRVRDWERRLAPLALAVPPVTPPPRLREAVLRALADGRAGRPASPDAGTPIDPDPATRDPVAHLRRQVRAWRAAAAGAGLLAAGLALVVALGGGPDRGPGGGPGGRYVAVVQGGGALPALIVRVDTRAGTARVRPVGAEAPAGHSLELWYVGAAGPQTLGLVGGAPSRVSLPPGAAADGAFAVTVEPPGGSPSGKPTGPAVYTGKLIAE